MFATWLSKILSTLLVAVLTSAIFTITLSQTLLNSRYLEQKLAATHSYSRLSVALSNQISTQATAVGNAEVSSKLQTILTPAELQSKVNGALDQLQAYYQGKAVQPSIDLTDLASQVQAAGVPVPVDSGIAEPVKLGGNTRMQHVAQNFERVRTVTMIMTAVLVVVLALLSWRRRQYKSLPNVLITVGILIGLLAGALAVGAGMLTHYLTFQTNAEAFTAIARDLGTSIANDLAQRFGIIAAVFLAFGVAGRVWAGKLQPGTSFTQANSQAASAQTTKAQL